MVARIIAVADTYDAITSTRPYRAAMPTTKAYDEIHKNKGTQFCPEVVEAFERAYNKGFLNVVYESKSESAKEQLIRNTG